MLKKYLPFQCSIWIGLIFIFAIEASIAAPLDPFPRENPDSRIQAAPVPESRAYQGIRADGFRRTELYEQDDPSIPKMGDPTRRMDDYDKVVPVECDWLKKHEEMLMSVAKTMLKEDPIRIEKLESILEKQKEATTRIDKLTQFIKLLNERLHEPKPE